MTERLVNNVNELTEFRSFLPDSFPGNSPEAALTNPADFKHALLLEHILRNGYYEGKERQIPIL